MVQATASRTFSKVCALHRRNVLCASVALLLSSRFVSFDSALGQSEPRDAVDRLIDWRSQCYSLVRRVKDTFKPKDKRVIETARRYEVTRRSCDVWIEKMRARLSLGEKLDDEPIRLAREAFAQSVDAFKTYVEDVLGIGSRGGFGAVLLLVPVLVDVGVKIYDAWDKNSVEQRRKLSAELDGLRFAPFDSL